MPESQVGLLVTSIAGRDRAKSYVIVGPAGPGFVHVVDGRVRKMDRPKRKNLKHLVVHHVADPDLLAKLAGGEPVTDELVRRALKRLDPEGEASTNSKTKEAEA